MASRPTLTLANTYTLIVEMQNSLDATVQWRNTWDIFSSSGAPAEGSDIVNAIVGWHQANLRTDAFIARLLMRNWSQGPQPFISRPFLWEQILTPTTSPGLKSSASPAGYGAEATGNQAVPGSVVAFVKRQTGTGAKPSNMFLRGLLDGADIAAETGGKPVFLPSPNVTGPKFDTITSHWLGAFFGGGPDPRLCIVHVGNKYAGPPFESSMSVLDLVGPSQNKQTRKNPR